LPEIDGEIQGVGGWYTTKTEHRDGKVLVRIFSISPFWKQRYTYTRSGGITHVKCKNVKFSRFEIN
jgi:hypothetical protein